MHCTGGARAHATPARLQPSLGHGWPPVHPHCPPPQTHWQPAAHAPLLTLRAAHIAVWTAKRRAALRMMLGEHTGGTMLIWEPWVHDERGGELQLMSATAGGLSMSIGTPLHARATRPPIVSIPGPPQGAHRQGRVDGCALLPAAVSHGHDYGAGDRPSHARRVAVARARAKRPGHEAVAVARGRVARRLELPRGARKLCVVGGGGTRDDGESRCDRVGAQPEFGGHCRQLGGRSTERLPCC